MNIRLEVPPLLYMTAYMQTISPYPAHGNQTNTIYSIVLK